MFTYDGKTYKSIEKCCEELGVSYFAVTTDACRNGTPHDEAIRKRIGKGSFEFKGKTYGSRNACCKALGLSYAAVRQKALQEGTTFEEALLKKSEGPINPNGNRTEFAGRVWKSKKALAEAYGMQKETVSARAKRDGTTFAEALAAMRAEGKGHEPKAKDLRENACFEFRGKTYSSMSQACGERGLFYPNVKRSVDSGMSKAEALEYWASRKEEREARRTFEYAGKKYSSLRACCKETGIKAEDVRRLTREEGMSRGEAVLECARRKKETSNK